MHSTVTPDPPLDLAGIQRLAIVAQLKEVELTAELEREFVESDDAPRNIEECHAKQKLDLLLLYQLSLQGMAGLLIENQKLKAQLSEEKN